MYERVENQKRISDFMEKTEQDTLVFFIHATNGTLICSNSFPTRYKSKAFYLIKKNPLDKIAKGQDIKSSVDFGGQF